MTEPNGTKDSTIAIDGSQVVECEPEPGSRLKSSPVPCGTNDPSGNEMSEGSVALVSTDAGLSLSPPIPSKLPDLPNGAAIKNGASFIKNKNYKAGSKINQLADMLAKRSKNFVEASQNILANSATPSEGPMSSEDHAPIKELEAADNVEKQACEEPQSIPSPPSSVESRLEPIATPPNALDDYGNSTKVKVVKTRTSPRCKVETDSQQTDSLVKVRKTKRGSKQLVEMSTQTADIQFISIRTEDEKLPPLPILNSAESHTFVCLYCHSTFSERRDCETHELSHSQKRKTKCIKCQFCSKKLPNLDELKLHSAKLHSNQFHVCNECDIRFVDVEKLTEHVNVEHPKIPETSSEKTLLSFTKKLKPSGSALNVDVTFEGIKKPTPSPRSSQRLSPRERADEQYEAEMLFYSHLSGNIQENLSKHLDGKIDQNEYSNLVVSADPPKTKSHSLISLAAPSTSSVPVCRAPSPYQTRSKTPNPLPTSAKKFKKLPNWQQRFWEKYNFPTSYRYEHRFWDKNYLNIERSSLYLKDLSSLDIKTQLTMRDNSKRLEESNSLPRNSEEDTSQSFPYFLNLAPRETPSTEPGETTTAPLAESLTQLPKKSRSKTSRKTRPSAQGSVVTRLQGGRQRKGSLDLTGEKKMSLRRQTSLENLDQKKVVSAPVIDDNPIIPNQETTEQSDGITDVSEITGEWVRPRSYLCGACYTRFNNLWELEDHKWAAHPNVWCNHYEFEDDKLKNLFKIEAENPEVSQIQLPDLYRRYLEPTGALNSAEAHAGTVFPQICSKCNKSCGNVPELHKHMLDCGGDTTWALTMHSSPHPNMKRKWRPYGSRRKKQIGRRCVKRSVPSTPVPRNYCIQHRVRTKPGDVETIQKMLANLPEKRTRRAINFDEISTRSQTTIQSNRLLRKRLNTTLASKLIRKKSQTRIRLNPKSKLFSETYSTESSDISSEVTPAATPPPRRMFQLKEAATDLTTVEPTSSGSLAAKRSKKERILKKAVTPSENEESDDGPILKSALKLPRRNAAVRRRADMVKRIKKKLRNSKRLLNARQVKGKQNKRQTRRTKDMNEFQQPALEPDVEIEAEIVDIDVVSIEEKPPQPKIIRKRTFGLGRRKKKRGKVPPAKKGEDSIVKDLPVSPDMPVEKVNTEVKPQRKKILENLINETKTSVEDAGNMENRSPNPERVGRSGLKKASDDNAVVKTSSRKSKPPKIEAQNYSVTTNAETVYNIPATKKLPKKRSVRWGKKKRPVRRWALPEESITAVVVGPTSEQEPVCEVFEEKSDTSTRKQTKKAKTKAVRKKKSETAILDSVASDTGTIDESSDRRTSLRLSKTKFSAEITDDAATLQLKIEDIANEMSSANVTAQETGATSRRRLPKIKALGLYEQAANPMTPNDEAIVVKSDIEEVTAVNPVSGTAPGRISRTRRSITEVSTAEKLYTEETVPTKDIKMDNDSANSKQLIKTRNFFSDDDVKEEPLPENIQDSDNLTICDATPGNIVEKKKRPSRLTSVLQESKVNLGKGTKKGADGNIPSIEVLSNSDNCDATLVEAVTRTLRVKKPKVMRKRKRMWSKKVVRGTKTAGIPIISEDNQILPCESVEETESQVVPKKAVSRGFKKQRVKTKINKTLKANKLDVLEQRDASQLEEPQTLSIPPIGLTEMPVLEKAETVDKISDTSADKHFPVLEAFEDADLAAVRFKVVKKSKKNSFSKVKVSPLKIVKEKIAIETMATGLPRKIIDETLVVADAGAKHDTDESDCEPLSKLQKEPVLARLAKDNNSDPRMASNEIEKTFPETNPSLAITVNNLPISRDGGSANFEVQKDWETQDAFMEKIISDKLSEGRSKKRVSGHKRGKKRELKRLRMTVTLKEATLKVLDKPATPLNPFKWTVGTPVTDKFNFEVTSTVESSIPLQPFPSAPIGDKISFELPPKVEPSFANASIADKVNFEVRSTIPDHLKQMQSFPVILPLQKESHPLLLEAKEGSLQENNKVVELDSVEMDLTTESEGDKLCQRLPEIHENTCQLNPSNELLISSATQRKITVDEENISDVTASQSDIVFEQPISIGGLQEASFSAERQVGICATDTSAPSAALRIAEECIEPLSDNCDSLLQPIDLSMDKSTGGVKPLGRSSPMLTIEEATSSEDRIIETGDRSKIEITSPVVPKIAEADSSAMLAGDELPAQRSTKDVEATKADMEPIVSSTGPAIQSKKRKRKARISTVSVECKEDVPSTTLVIPEELDRRSRRRSKEVPKSNEFIVDDPLILVDELWSDLDSDSDSKQKRKVRKMKKRATRKRDGPTSDVDLEALLRNFGANKSGIDAEKPSCSEDRIKCLRKKDSSSKGPTSRQQIERKVVIKENSYNRLSLMLFSFNRKVLRHGHLGSKLLKVKKVLYDAVKIPELPLPPSEVTENPEQVIVCRSSKVKSKKTMVVEPEQEETVQLKISLPLELLGDLSILNNNHGGERTENLNVSEPIIVEDVRPMTPDVKQEEPKSSRSDVIDKIFSCDICQTYYYTASQLKNHKMSNRHKLKEAEVREGGSEEAEVAPTPGEAEVVMPSATAKAALEEEKSGEDTCEMPVLEGPFIETGCEPRSEQPPRRSLFGFSEESLKDLQNAIGCTDEEMLLLSLLGENTSTEQDKVDVEKRSKLDSVVRNVKGNVSLQSNLKQRMTSALAGLVNRAVNNLLNKSDTAIGTHSSKSEKSIFLSKLSDLNDRKQKALLKLARIQDEPTFSETKGKPVQLPPSVKGLYKYECTICGNRFEKESTRDYHLIRTHRQGKRPKSGNPTEDMTPPSEEWNDSWLDYDEQEVCEAASPQFWCSDCGINFLSPKEVREHQQAEHPASAPEDSPRVRTPIPKRPDLDPDQERLLAKQELQKLCARKYSRKHNQIMWGTNSVKYKPVKAESTDDSCNTLRTSLNSDIQKSQEDRFKKIVDNNLKRKAVEDAMIEENAVDDTSWKAKKTIDVYDFNDSEWDTGPIVLSHTRKSTTTAVSKPTTEDDDSEDNIPLSSVKTPLKMIGSLPGVLTPPDTDEAKSKPQDGIIPLVVEEDPVPTLEETPESFKISLENRLLRLDEIPLRKTTPSPSPVEDEASQTLDDSVLIRDESTSSNIVARRVSEESFLRGDSDDQISENVIYQRNDSDSSYDSPDDDGDEIRSLSDRVSSTSEGEDEDTSASEGVRRTKKIVPLLTATLTNNVRKSESPKVDKEVIVRKIWNRQKCGREVLCQRDESQSSEIDKETIMKRIWRKKRAEAEEVENRLEEIKLNQTEVSDEVVIKCGPKSQRINRRKSANETAKDVIVRRIWSGKCGFQTKAALKTYESDIVPTVNAAKRRGRPASMSSVKRKRPISPSEDDLDSLLEEIEQENVEKAIRSEFLHMRRTERSQIDSSKEPAGLFAETKKTNSPENKRRRIKRNARREDASGLRNRKHRRHHHHHKKQRRQKSRHHKRIFSKHKSKHRGSPGGIKVLERMCENIATLGDSELAAGSVSAGKIIDSRVSSDLDNLDSKIDQVLSPLCSFGKQLNGLVSSEIFTLPTEEDSNHCSSKEDL